MNCRPVATYVKVSPRSKVSNGEICWLSRSFGEARAARSPRAATCRAGRAAAPSRFVPTTGRSDFSQETISSKLILAQPAAELHGYTHRLDNSPRHFPIG